MLARKGLEHRKRCLFLCYRIISIAKFAEFRNYRILSSSSRPKLLRPKPHCPEAGQWLRSRSQNYWPRGLHISGFFGKTRDSLNQDQTYKPKFWSPSRGFGLDLETIIWMSVSTAKCWSRPRSRGQHINFGRSRGHIGLGLV